MEFYIGIKAHAIKLFRNKIVSTVQLDKIELMLHFIVIFQINRVLIC
jgi:hypothetical protein